MENSKRRPRHRAEESVPARRSSAGGRTRVSAEAGQSSRWGRGARRRPRPRGGLLRRRLRLSEEPTRPAVSRKLADLAPELEHVTPNRSEQDHRSEQGAAPPPSPHPSLPGTETRLASEASRPSAAPLQGSERIPAEYRTGDAEAPGSRHRVRSQEESESEFPLGRCPFMDPNVPTGLPERDGCRKASDPRADDERSPGHDRTRSAGGRAARPTRPGQCSSQRRGQSAAGISMRSLRGARSAGRPGPTSSQKPLFAVSRQSARPCPK